MLSLPVSKNHIGGCPKVKAFDLRFQSETEHIRLFGCIARSTFRDLSIALRFCCRFLYVDPMMHGRICYRNKTFSSKLGI